MKKISENLSIIIICLAVLTSCQINDYNINEGESKIVVEGWIEEGEVAHVLLSRSVPLNEIVDSTNHLNYSIRTAMVIVSDDIDSDTLRLTYTSNYLPPYLYKGEKIIGQVGKHYKLTIHSFNQTITSETYIPQSVPINKLKYTRTNPTDTTGYITVEFSNPPDMQNYYQIATKIESIDEIFVPCLYGNFNSDNFTTQDVSIQITRGITIFPQRNYDFFFTDGDLIFVRLRTMPKEGFDFWNIWQNEIINRSNAIFPANNNLKSNIDGGIGIWCGYGQSTIGILAQ
ncbi:MAG: DUF4249 domain-containing protein [Marinilabiliaceae bacterium]|nr:DUF4249 domain-containing protein [Marinilabiliaceae bacterium]